MPATRPELSQDMHVFYVTAQGYAADHWYGWLPKALNQHPEIFALLAHEGSRPKYLKERTRSERPDIIAFTHFLNDMGMTYEAIGDCYSYRAHMLVPLKLAFGDGIPVANIVRHPYAWLEFYTRWRTSNMRMADGSTGPLDWEWKVARHDLFKEKGLNGYGKDDVEIWATYQGIHMLNQVVPDVRFGVLQVRLEDLVRDPNVFRRLVEHLTKGRCAYSDGLLEQVYQSVNTPFRGEEPLRMVPRELYEGYPDWKRDALEKLLEPQSARIFEQMGYRLRW